MQVHPLPFEINKPAVIHISWNAPQADAFVFFTRENVLQMERSFRFRHSFRFAGTAGGSFQLRHRPTKVFLELLGI
jgi:hypothetical protein